jgi:hypothetical protein
MESTSDASSQEELLQLRNDGKISEAEYQDLLDAMKKTASRQTGRADQDTPKPVPTCGFAVASLVFSLVGPLGSLPAIICGHVALRRIKKEPSLRGYGLGLAGLVIGYVVLVISLLILPGILLPYMLAHAEMIELRRFPIDGTEQTLTKSGLQMDKEVSSDGNGSVRIEATEPTTIRLFETGDIDIENASLIYQAHLRTAGVFGFVYLEMWCSFEGKGEFFSRGLADPLTGTTNWTTQEIMFRLKKHENPNNVKLNIVIDGKGTVWLDDIRLSALK